MERRKLGRTDIDVSVLCLGSMTWGAQNTTAEGHAQIDRALDAGINFIDTAEMYPVNPISADTIGDTETVIGKWFAGSNRRSDVVLATKHSGAGVAYVRDGAPITAESIPGTLEGSLKRLQTDYIDLYQFHWPNRGSYMFRQNWTYDPSGQDPVSVRQNMDDCLGTLQKQVDRGVIRAFGLSNESAWGTAQWLAAAGRTGGPRVASVQNEYSLMCRLYDTDMAELSVNEDVGLLSFSPLATGLLTGKYQGGAVPEKSRLAVAMETGGTGDLGGRLTDRALPAVDAYLKIAHKHGLDPTQMALAWCVARPFMCSVIFGATTMDQLEVALGATDVRLGDEVLAEIDAAHRAHPLPY